MTGEEAGELVEPNPVPSPPEPKAHPGSVPSTSQTDLVCEDEVVKRSTVGTCAIVCNPSYQRVDTCGAAGEPLSRFGR